MFTPENLRILQALTSQLLADLTNNRLSYSEQEMMDLQLGFTFSRIPLLRFKSNPSLAMVSMTVYLKH